MKDPAFPQDDDLVAPACRRTVDRLQLVLDGELEAVAIEADPHTSACAACRQRVAAARVVLSVLATAEPVDVPADLTDRILAAVKEDRFSRVRRRTFVVSAAAVAALAASLLFLMGYFAPPKQSPEFVRHPGLAPKWDPKPEIAPEPRPAPPPEVKPLRIGDELSKAGLALRESPRAITEPAAAAPEVFAKLTDAFAFPDGPMPDTQPARAALADFPEVARTGLEPLTGTAQKAFSRLMRDVGAVSVKPKS